LTGPRYSSGILFSILENERVFRAVNDPSFLYHKPRSESQYTVSKKSELLKVSEGADLRGFAWEIRIP
jgi:hypothetical protein